MKTLKSIALTIILALSAILGLASPASAFQDCKVADCFNVLRNNANMHSLASDPKLDAIAQRLAQTGEPLNPNEFPGAESVYRLIGAGGSNTAAVDSYITKPDQRATMMQENWNAMGSGSSVRADGFVHTVSILVQYPKQAAAPAPAPAPAAPRPAPAVVNPQPQPQPEVQAPAPAPAPVEAPVEEPAAEPEAPKEEKPAEEPKDEKADEKVTPSATPSPEPTKTAEAVAATGNDSDGPSGTSLVDLVQKASLPASGVLGLLCILSTVMFLKHRRMSREPEDSGGATAVIA